MHFGGFMGGVVVNDGVKLTFAVIGELGVDAVQKGQECPGGDGADDIGENPSSSGRVVSCKERKSPVTHIIVS